MSLLEITTATWGLVFALFCLYRWRFLNQRVMEQPVHFESVHRALMWLHLALLCLLYLLAAQVNDSVLLLQAVCVASGGHIISDWFSYRRALLKGAQLQEKENGMQADTAIRVARRLRFGDTASFREGKKGKAWLTFLLVLLLGPFGFLYSRWRVTVAILLAIGPWSVFATQRIGDILQDPWTRYPLLLAVASLAWADVRRRNLKVPENELL